MAQIDIADAAMAGVRLTTKKPLTVLAWGALSVAYIALLVALFGAGIVNAISNVAKSGSASPAPEMILAMIGSLFGFIGLLFLGMVVIGTVVIAAALRAELEPEKSAFGYLRLGGQEMWVLGANVVLFIVFAAVGFVLGIPLAIVTAALGLSAAAGGGFPQNPGGMVQAMSGMIGIRLLGQLAIQVVVVWLWCRLGPGVVMTFKERQFRLFESWNLTKGHAWRIFLSMLLVWLIMMAILFVAYIIIIAVAVGTIATVPGISDPTTFFARPPSEWISIFGPTAFVVGLVMVVMIGVSVALRWAALANIYKQLQPPAAVAETFA